jgi:hypothetical protein
MNVHSSRRTPAIHAVLALAVVFVILFMGCILPQQAPAQATAATPVPTAPAATVATEATSAPIATASEVPTVTGNLPYGVTIAYPQNWERKDVSTSAVRDYGRNTVNIANFFSPDAIPSDSESYTTLGIDIDQSPDTTDLEQYFNLATVGLGKYYGSSFDITKHSYQLKISGYKSYELDWQTKDEKGLYIFTEAKGDVYIFAFKSPNKPMASGAYSAEIEQMYKSVSLNPPDPVLVKHR